MSGFLRGRGAGLYYPRTRGLPGATEVDEPAGPLAPGASVALTVRLDPAKLADGPLALEARWPWGVRVFAHRL